MIKNIFLPQRIDSYYLFSKRIAAFDINPAEIHVTVVLAKGRSRTIVHLLTERIETDSTLSHDERVIQALKLLAQKLGPVDEIVYVLPSSQVIFKELSLPFTGLKKIKMVVPFEVESLLPFTLDSAVIDCIITKEDNATHQSDILVAAVKKEQIDQATRLFDAAGLLLHKISVDMFELYGLYKMVTAHADKKNVALIDIGYYTTRLAVIIEGQLSYIRAIPQGLVTTAKKLTARNKGDASENLHHLIHFGINEVSNETFSHDAQEALSELIGEIQFTIESFTKKLKQPQQLSTAIVAGAAADIPGIREFMHQITHLEIQLLQPKQLLHNAVMQSKITPLPNNFIVSIATALSPEVTADFNLQKVEVEKEEETLINYQLITLAALAALIFISFSLYSFLRVRNLRLAYKEAETEAITELNKSFKLKPSNTVNLQAANKAASNELKKQESAWHRLSTENRFGFLRYLSELSRCIHLKDTQLALTNVTLTEDTIKLYGSVPGYQQLTKLQNELECPLFKKLPKLQDWNFKSNPITLTINREEA